MKPRYGTQTMMRVTCLSLVFLVSASTMADPGGGPIQGGYSTRPLEKAVFDSTYVLVDSVGFNNWLNERYPSLDSDSMKGPREHLFYLIDSQVKSLYASEGVVLPEKDDFLLASLYAWSERLGVYGGHLVYNRLKPADAPEAKTLREVPEGYRIALREDVIEVTSDPGHWSVGVPYHFMIWMLLDFQAKDGPRTQFVTISTGAAKHEGQAGHSQATLVLLHGPGADMGSFVRYWSEAYGFSGEENEKKLGVRGLTSRTRIDAEHDLYTEWTAWNTDSGPMMVFYSGINGTYQWNRPHFLDFVKSVRSW